MAFDAKGRAELHRLADRFAQKPISSVWCALFSTEAEAAPWVELRHTGANDGAGLVEWGAEEKDRHFARRGNRSSVLQVLDFVDKADLLSPQAKASKQRIHTSVRRLINTPAVRERLGIEIVDGQIHTYYPKEQTAKALSRLVEDLKTTRVKVKNIYHEADRERYAKNFPSSHAPDKKTRLATLTTLDGAPSSPAVGRGRRARKRKRREAEERAVLIPAACELNIGPPRINNIYVELAKLNAPDFPNACSVTLRVLLELSVDHYIEKQSLVTEDKRRNMPLAKRMRIAAADLHGKKKISGQLKDAVERVANSSVPLAASSVTFNQYVHNKYVFPKYRELISAFDELQPFFEALWP